MQNTPSSLGFYCILANAPSFFHILKHLVFSVALEYFQLMSSKLYFDLLKYTYTKSLKFSKFLSTFPRKFMVLVEPIELMLTEPLLNFF